MQFGSTRWSLIQKAGGDDEESRIALDELCRTYWPPVYALVRSKGYSHTDSEDFTQGFFAFVLEKDVFTRADLRRGRFRNFLKAAVRNFLANQWDRETAEKRGGVAIHISIEDAEWLASSSENGSDGVEFDRAWGLTLLSRALDRLGREYSDRQRGAVFDALKPVLTGEGLERTYREIGKEVSISETAVKLTVRRMRARFRDLLEQDILDTVSSPEEAEQELADLRAVFVR